MKYLVFSLVLKEKCPPHEERWRSKKVILSNIGLLQYQERAASLKDWGRKRTYQNIAMEVNYITVSKLKYQ